FFFQAEDGIRDFHVTGVQTCALPISRQGKRPSPLATSRGVCDRKSYPLPRLVALHSTGSWTRLLASSGRSPWRASTMLPARSAPLAGGTGTFSKYRRTPCKPCGPPHPHGTPSCSALRGTCLARTL